MAGVENRIPAVTMIKPAALKILCVGGARPNFMKLAPLVRALRQDAAFEPVLVHTGQHYDEKMSGQFFRELGMLAPAHNLEVGSASHAQQTGEIMKRFEPVLLDENPAAVVVVGDVNSTVACALVAKKLLYPVVHVEAGLRSLDRSMPEEINRIVTDAISDLLLVTEESGMMNLLREGIPEARVVHVGNLMIDSLYYHLEKAKDSDVITRLGIPSGPFGLVTLHRPANVDDPERLAELMRALDWISQDLPLYFPVHPRTQAHLRNGNVGRHIHLIDPLGYLDFLGLMFHSSAVFTDSGGIQEETTVLGRPCLTLRENTERPVTIEQGTNTLAGTTYDSIVSAWKQVRVRPKTARVPKMWDGHAADRSLVALGSFLKTN